MFLRSSLALALLLAMAAKPIMAQDTTYLETVFFHDDAVSAGGSYEVSYFYEGCVNPIVPLPNALAVRRVTGAATPFLSLYPTTTTNTCGLDEDTECTTATQLRYNMQLLSDITNSDIKSVVGSESFVKFCIRLSLLDSNGFERGFKKTDVEVKWSTNEGFSSTVITSENEPDNETVDIGDIEVNAEICSDIAPGAIPTVYNQGEQVQICLSADVTPDNADVSVVIVAVNDLRFWIDNNLGGNVNGVYDVGETTQVGMAGGDIAGTTTILPPGVPGGSAVCDLAFGPTYIDGSTDEGCVLTTFLGEAFFFESTVTADGTNSVNFAGTVTIEFNNGNRRVLQLRNSEMFAKSFNSQSIVTVTEETGTESDNSCECSGVFFIICWIFKCLLGFLF